MEYRFSNKRQRSKGLVMIASEEGGQRDKFRFLGPILHNNGELEEDLIHLIKAGW